MKIVTENSLMVKLSLKMKGVLRYSWIMRLILSVFLLFLFIFPAFSVEEDVKDYFLLADEPITYGEEHFRTRILDRTKGDRDPIGLVLTGGSARALAHLGVLKYMEEEGIVPDFIVSNSMGSIIGLLYAAGMRPEQIAELMNVGELSNYFNFTIPIYGGLLLPSSFKTLVKSVVGENLDLKDLPIPVMVVCDDLVTKREIRITEGNFADILIASFALPVYFPPVEYRGHLLLDGGVKSLAPIDAAYEYTDTVIISSAFYDNDDLNLLNPITILNSAFDVGKRQRAAEDIKMHGDDLIWIRPEVEQFSFMEFSAADEMMDLGYEAAKRESESLAKLYKSAGGDFDEIREEYAANIQRTRNNLYFFNRIESNVPSHIIDIGFKSYQEVGRPYYLRDNIELGLEYFFRYQPVEVRVLVGGAFETRTTSKADAYPVLSFLINYYPLDFLRLSLDTSVNFDLVGESDWYIPSVYVREGFDIKLYSSPDVGNVEFNESFEYFLSPTRVQDEKERFLLTAQIAGDFNVPWGALRANVGYQLTGINFNRLPHSYVQGGLSTRILFPFDIYIDLGGTVRGAVDGQGNVPIYYADGFETNMIVPGVGYGNIRSSESLVSIVNFALGYKLPFNPTIAEFLIFEDIELGGYFDMLFDGGEFYYSTGAEVQCIFSVIGLIEIPLRVRIGYESLSPGGAFCLSWIFGTKF